MTWTHLYLAAGFLTLVISALLTGFFRRVGTSWQLFDRPNSEKHKGHVRSVPLLGGPAMFLAWGTVVIGGVIAAMLGGGWLPESVRAHLGGMVRVTPQLLGILLGAVLLVAIGMIDDHGRMRARTKLLGQVVAAVLVVSLGIRATFFVGIPGVSWFGSVFWIVFLINAINFLDNMDGLAAGIGTLAAVFFALVAGFQEQYFVATLAAVTAGAAAGFLLHNRPPASIFMGDAGSHFLGFLLAILGILVTYYAPETTPTPTAVLIPFLILAVPILDLMAVVAARIRLGKPMHVGDHTHISHRFEKMGFSRAQSVVLVYLLVFATGASGLFLVWAPAPGAALALLQAAAVLMAVGILQYGGGKGA